MNKYLIRAAFLIQCLSFIMTVHLKANEDTLKVSYGNLKYMDLVRDGNLCGTDTAWYFKSIPQFNGLIAAYYDSSFTILAATLNYVNGKREGIFELLEMFTKRPRVRLIYVDNWIVQQEYFYCTGKLKSLTAFGKDGYESGQKLTFYESGQIRSHENALNDTLLGLQRYWYENGILRAAIPLSPSHNDSTGHIYWPDGSIRMTFEVQPNNVYRYIQVRSPDGHLIVSETSDKWVEYYSDKRIRSVVGMKDGFLEGLRIVYDSTGNKISEEPFKRGVVHGCYKEYDTSGKVKYSCDYVEGKRHGHEIWFKDGSPYKMLEWKRDRLVH